MSERTQLDQMRDLLDGRLAPAEAETLRAAIEADAGLRAEFEAFLDVHGMTAAEAPVAPSQVTADDVLSRTGGRVLRPRRWLVAAAILSAATFGTTLAVTWRDRHATDVEGDRVVFLLALGDPARFVRHPGDPVPKPPGPPPEVPAALADFAPVRDGKPQWVASWEEGRAIARAASKPLFAYVFHPDCPLCHELDERTFADPSVLADLAEFVPVRIDVTTLDEKDPFTKRLAAGWPYLAAMRVDERTIHELAGRSGLADVQPELHRAALEAWRLDPAQPSWEKVREAAKTVRQAEELAARGRSGDALRLLDRARGLVPASGVSQRARWDASKLQVRAQVLLGEVAAGRADASALDQGAAEFAGSQAGDDLAAVSRAMRETGRFPRLRDTESNR